MEISATPPPSPPRRVRSGPIPFLNDPHPARSCPLNVIKDEWMPLGRAAHLSTALIDYLLQRSLPEELPGTTIVGSSNAMRYMEQYVKIRSSNSRSDVRLVETMQRQYAYYSTPCQTKCGKGWQEMEETSEGSAGAIIGPCHQLQGC